MNKPSESGLAALPIRLEDMYAFLNNAKKADRPQPETDPADPFRPPHTGVFDLSEVLNARDRRLLVYLPSTTTPSGPALMLFAEGGAAEALEGGDWKQAADRCGFALLVLEGAGGRWNRNDFTADMLFAKSAFLSATIRDLYAVNEPTFYVYGEGEAALSATVFSLLNAERLAGFCVQGAACPGESLLQEIGRLPAQGGTTKSRVALNAWVIDRAPGENEPLVRYLLDAIEAEDAPLQSEAAKVWRQRPDPAASGLNEERVVEVWHSTAADGGPKSPDKEAIWRFLARTKRHMGFGTGHFRLWTHLDGPDFRRYEETIEGWRRRWDLFIPTAARQGTEKQPLVVAIHGYSCTGEIFAGDSQWHKTGEDRGFYVVYPSAVPGHFPGTNNAPLPCWNMTDAPGAPDDVSFLRHMVKRLLADHPIDPQRVYVAGHSNGSGITQVLMLKAPELFAGFGPVGYTLGEERDDSYEDLLDEYEAEARSLGTARVPCPVFYVKGDGDLFSAADFRPDRANHQMVDFACRRNGMRVEAHRMYRNGPYEHHLFRSENGAPMVRFTAVRGFPHAYVPEISRFTWDEFFVHFRRLEDGSIGYEG